MTNDQQSLVSTEFTAKLMRGGGICKLAQHTLPGILQRVQQQNGFYNKCLTFKVSTPTEQINGTICVNLQVTVVTAEYVKLLTKTYRNIL